MSDYLYHSAQVGKIELSRQALTGNTYYVDITPSDAVADAVSGTNTLNVNIVSSSDSSVVLTGSTDSLEADKKQGIGIDIPSNYASGEYRIQVQIPYVDEDFEATDSERFRFKFLHYELQVSKLGEINRTRLERLWQAVNNLIESRLAQGIDSKAGSYMATDGIVMTFANFTELIEFRDRLAVEISYKKTGGIRSRQVIVDSGIL